MTQVVLRFGVLSGLVSSVIMAGTVPFMDRIGFDTSAIVGYAAMVMSFLFVYLGVRSYRDDVAGGTVGFGAAFGVGLLITLISSLCYVITWEVIYFTVMPDFMDSWGAATVERARLAGQTPEAIDAIKTQMAEFRRMYDSPLMNALFTLSEPLPVGLLVTLVSAMTLKKTPSGDAARSCRRP